MMGQTWKLGTLEIKNPFVRRATDETLTTPEGAPTQRLIDITPVTKYDTNRQFSEGRCTK